MPVSQKHNPKSPIMVDGHIRNILYANVAPRLGSSMEKRNQVSQGSSRFGVLSGLHRRHLTTADGATQKRPSQIKFSD